MSALLFLATLAVAEDSPWGPTPAPQPSESPWGPAPEAPAPVAAPAPTPAATPAPPATDKAQPGALPVDGPWPAGLRPSEVDGDDGDKDPDGFWNVPAEGHRIVGIGEAAGVVVSHGHVIGGDGGSSATTVGVRWGAEKWQVGAYLPFAAFSTPGQRTTALGNLRIEGFYRLRLGEVDHAFGLEAHAPIGRTPSWTWVNRADELWPSGGGAAVYQLKWRKDRVTVLARGSFGVSTSSGVAPFPRLWVTGLAAGAVDWSFHDRAGLIGEVSAGWWDTSPLDVAAMVRVEPIEGLRLRTGAVLPMFVWAGLDPAARPSGAREFTWTFDLAMML